MAGRQTFSTASRSRNCCSASRPSTGNQPVCSRHQRFASASQKYDELPTRELTRKQDRRYAPAEGAFAPRELRSLPQGGGCRPLHPRANARGANHPAQPQYNTYCNNGPQEGPISQRTQSLRAARSAPIIAIRSLTSKRASVLSALARTHKRRRRRLLAASVAQATRSVKSS